MNKFLRFIKTPNTLLLIALLFISCKPERPLVNIMFNPDNAYQHIIDQIKYGARVPDTPAHDSVIIFINNFLDSLGAEIYIQKANVKMWNNSDLEIKNIIASFYPEKKDRILLFTHYDTRAYSDGEKDTALLMIPILGANDGASGVAVLMETARIVSEKEPDVGVDFIFFDAEDQGPPELLAKADMKFWCLGSQYWSKNKHKADYRAQNGICVDLVGAKSSYFPQEDHSRHFANVLLRNIWDRGYKLGFDSVFVEKMIGPIFDDHVYVSKEAGIRSVLIIGFQENNSFGDYWHTQKDDINNIDKHTLYAVGNVLIQTIYTCF